MRTGRELRMGNVTKSGVGEEVGRKWDRVRAGVLLAHLGPELELERRRTKRHLLDLVETAERAVPLLAVAQAAPHHRRGLLVVGRVDLLRKCGGPSLQALLHVRSEFGVVHHLCVWNEL